MTANASLSVYFFSLLKFQFIHNNSAIVVTVISNSESELTSQRIICLHSLAA